MYSIWNCDERQRKTCPYIFSSSGLGRRRILGVAVTAAVDKIRRSVVNILYVYNCQQHVRSAEVNV